MFTEIGEAGIGIVVWNERGEVMASLAEKKFPCLPSVEVLEALAARKAAVFTVKLGLHWAIIEGDSKLCSRPYLESILIDLA